MNKGREEGSEPRMGGSKGGKKVVRVWMELQREREIDRNEEKSQIRTTGGNSYDSQLLPSTIISYILYYRVRSSSCILFRQLNSLFHFFLDFSSIDFF